MAGTNRGRIEIFMGDGDGGNDARDLWTSIYAHVGDLITAGVAELVALYYGVGGTGVDYTGGGAPSGPGAFFVFRLVPNANRAISIYWLFSWSDDSNVNNGSSAPADKVGPDAGGAGTTGNVTCAVCSAIDDAGADAVPWLGTTNADGTDSKADPVWGPPAGGSAFYMPRQNQDGQANAVSRDGVVTIYEINGTYFSSRANVLSDDDYFLVTVDEGDNGSWDRFAWAGPLEPLTDGTDLVDAPMLFAADSQNDWIDLASDDGGYGGGTRCGAIFSPLAGVNWQLYTDGMESAYTSNQPNDCYDPPRYMTRALVCYAGLSDTFSRDGMGQIGRVQPDFLSLCFGLAGSETLNGLEQISFNSAASAGGVAPWDGTTTPGTGATPQGVAFP